MVGRDLLSNMGWPFEDLIAYASRGTRVRPGDVLGSGTCGNGGCLAELWGRGTSRDELPPLRPGDVVTLTVEGIGTIANRVVPGVDPIPVPAARPRPAPVRRVRSGHDECQRRGAADVVSSPGARRQGHADARQIVTGAAQGDGRGAGGSARGPSRRRARRAAGPPRTSSTGASTSRRPRRLGRPGRRSAIAVDGLVAQRRHHLAGPARRGRARRLGPRAGRQRRPGRCWASRPRPADAGRRRRSSLVGSVAGLTGHYPVAYTTSKWALRGLAKAACLELGPRGIRVNIVHPGYIETPMTASARTGVP